MGIKGHSISPFVATLSVLIIGLAVITYSLLSGAWYIFASICFFPFLLIMAIQALKKSFCRCMSPIHIQLLFHSLVQIHAGQWVECLV